LVWPLLYIYNTSEGILISELQKINIRINQNKQIKMQSIALPPSQTNFIFIINLYITTKIYIKYLPIFFVVSNNLLNTRPFLKIKVSHSLQ
jgi:hypothetical protein